MKTRILKSTLKGLFLNIIIKSQQEHPLCSPILIFTARTKESNIFTYFVLLDRFSRQIYQNKQLTITTFHQTSLFLELF